MFPLINYLRQYTHKFAKRLSFLLPKLLAANPLRRKPLDHSCSKALWEAYPLETWDDASLDEVAVYLRGSTSLMIPDGWRDLLPTHL